MTASEDHVVLVDGIVDRERLVELVAWLLRSSPDLASALDTYRSHSAEYPLSNSRTWLGRDLEHEPVLDRARVLFEQSPDLWSRRRVRGVWWVGVGGGSAGASYVLWQIATPVTSMLVDGIAGVTAILAGINAVLATSTGLVKLCAPSRWQCRGAWRELVGEAAVLAGASGATVRQRAVWRERAGSLIGRDLQSPPRDLQSSSAASITAVRQALSDLLGEWASYRLDIEAWYLTKPLLHDTTGTVATTVAYETAMGDLAAAVDDLHDGSPATDVAAAVSAADRAWATWHEANDYAAQVGVGDRTPTERAALQRLSKLVTRLTRSAAGDPELAAIKRDIQTCLDKVTTVSVGWPDIAALPPIERAGVMPQLGATAPR